MCDANCLCDISDSRTSDCVTGATASCDVVAVSCSSQTAATHDATADLDGVTSRDDTDDVTPTAGALPLLVPSSAAVTVSSPTSPSWWELVDSYCYSLPFAVYAWRLLLTHAAMCVVCTDNEPRRPNYGDNVAATDTANRQPRRFRPYLLHH